MNDLAEQVLRGLDLSRHKIAAHPVASLGTGGFAASAVVVVAGGRVGTSGETTRSLTRWLGLLPDEGIGQNAAAGAIMFGAIIALLALWVVAVAVLRDGRIRERQAWAMLCAWGAPFAVGPPLLSTDVYAYVGRGLLQRAGRDPYVVGPGVLQNHPVIDAIDPTWRSAPSTSGPLGTFVQHLAVAITGAHGLATVLVLRVIAVGCVVGIALLAADLAGPRRAPAIVITALNPAMLLYVVCGAHLDGALALLLLAALVSATGRRWLVAIVLVCAAAALKPVALVVLPALVLTHWSGRRTRPLWQIAARDIAVAAAVLTIFTFLVPDGLGWRRNLATLTREHTPFAPANIVSNIVGPIVPAASFDDRAAGGRIAVVLAAIVVVCYLLATLRRRPLERTFGYALLAAALLGPALYPWYLIWGVTCLAPTATGLRRDWVVALSCAACVLVPAGFDTRTAEALTLVTLVVFGLALLPVLHTHYVQRRRYALR